MRLASHFLALLLAISSIAVPCLAKTPAERPATAALAGTTAVEADDDHCTGPCLKAIVSRKSDFDHAIIPHNLDIDLILASKPLYPYPGAKRLATFKPPKSTCIHPVDLFFLCRQLN